jgi:hypothetical protein
MRCHSLIVNNINTTLPVSDATVMMMKYQEAEIPFRIIEMIK